MLTIYKNASKKLIKTLKKGFTLIELLAVIVILAVIALIAVPQVIKILNKARLSSAEDSVYGIVKSVDNYVTSFMLKNDGSFPDEDLEFSCGKEGCNLDNSLEGYNLNNLKSLSFKGVKPSFGTVKATNKGKNVYVDDLIINGFRCIYPSNEGKAKCYTDEQLKNIIKINNIGLTPGVDSIRVVLSVSGNVSKYEYSIDNENFFESDTNTYTFNGLESNKKYTIYVRISNNENKVEDSKDVITLSLSLPEIEPENGSIWTPSKKVTIKYPEGESLEYSYIIKSLDGATVIKEETQVIDRIFNFELTEQAIVIAIVKNKDNEVKYTKEITHIDSTAPTSATFETTSTSNSIKVTASGTDNESGITHYQFSKDGGSAWLPSTPQTSSTYTFNGLTSGSYNIKVRVYNGTYENGGRLYKDSDPKVVYAVKTNLLLTYDSYYACYPVIDDNNFTVKSCAQSTVLYFDSSGYSFDYSTPAGLIYCDLNDNCSDFSEKSGTYTVPYAGYLKLPASGASIENIVTGNNEKVVIDLKVLATSYSVGNDCTFSGSFLVSCANRYKSGDTVQGPVYLLFAPLGQKYQVKIDDDEWRDDFVGGPDFQYYLLSKNGKHTIVARTVVSDGVYSEETEPFIITIKNQPKINSFTATSGSVKDYNTTSVTLTATATSEIGISKYEFYKGGTLINTVETSATTATVSAKSLGKQALQFSVVVYDSDGNSSSSSLTESCSKSASYACTTVYTCTGTGRKYSVSSDTCKVCQNETFRGVSCSKCSTYAQEACSTASSDCNRNGGTSSQCTNACNNAASKADSDCQSCCV